MKRSILSVAALLCAAFLFAQEPELGGAASKKYREYRETLSKPVFGLSKIEALIKKHKLITDGDDSKLPAAVYKKLTTAERFTYHMLHGEAYAQNCEAMPVYADEEKRIWAYPPAAFNNERGWSEEQQKVIKANRKAFLPLVKKTIETRKRVGCNIKQVILDLNMVELIPTLVSTYKAKRYDHDILSTLMLLMVAGNYEPFMTSQSYKKLYSEDASYQSFLVANRENQDLIISRATAFYISKFK